MAPLSLNNPVTEELMKRDRIAAVVAMLRRATGADDFDLVTFVTEVLKRIPGITDDEVKAGIRMFGRELRSIRRPALLRTIAWRALCAILFVGSAALVVAVSRGAF